MFFFRSPDDSNEDEGNFGENKGVILIPRFCENVNIKIKTFFRTLFFVLKRLKYLF